jgi:hypothetical protein
MRKLSALLLLLLLLFIACSTCLFAQTEDSITITTYYPSPYGMYNELNTFSNTNLAISGGNVGIGTSSPQARLDVAGGAKIGDDTGGCNSNKAGTLRYNSGKVQYCDGSTWKDFGGAGWYVPTSIIRTTSTHNGNFGGYSGMYDWIQTNGCPGYHVCDNVEVIRYAQLHAWGTGTSAAGWVAHGTLNFNNDFGVENCYVFTSTAAYGHVGFMNYGSDNTLQGQFSRDVCTAAYPVLCCK